MTITAADLPFSKDTLEPHMSKRTVEFHYEKHHKGYARKLNDAIAGTDLEDKSLTEIVKATVGDEDRKAIFNNAAQVWNHDFFWAGMSAQRLVRPSGNLANLIDSTFGGLKGLKEKFTAAAMARFGSGYAWLVLDNGALKIVTTANAATPLTGKATPLLCCDLWEHAYYLDYQNARAKFVEAFLDHLIDWAVVAERFGPATRQPTAARARVLSV